MRVVELLSGADQHPQGSSPRLDGFAGLRAAGFAETPIGGYLVLPPRHVRRPHAGTPEVSMHPQVPAQLPGVLSVVLAGALALFALGGPASCLCDTKPGVDRFAYTKTSAMVVASGVHPSTAPVAAQTAAPSEPAQQLEARPAVPQGAAGMSAISTSAIEGPAYLRPAFARRAGTLPPRMLALAATAPEPIKLVAAPMAGGADAASPPVLAVTTPSTPAIIAADVEPEPDAKAHRATSRAATAHSARRRASSARHSNARSAGVKKIKRAPRWAQQMFENPWQNTAFSYVR